MTNYSGSETPSCSISQNSTKYFRKTKLFITLFIKFRDADKHSYGDKYEVVKGRQHKHKQAALYRCRNAEVPQYKFECSATNLRRLLMLERNCRSRVTSR